jgi:DNA-binding transcriptional LysR family regulator
MLSNIRLSLRQLEVFMAVARQQGVTRAAATLSLSQSATSSALAELERQYGAQLFDRIGKRVRLNDLGKAVVPRAAELLDRARELESVLYSREVAGELHVGATLTIGNYLGSQIISEYTRRFPQTRVSLQVENTARIIARVAEFDLDLGLVEGRCSHSDIDVIHWGEDALEVFCAPDHPLAGKRRITPADLARASWILREPGSGTRDTFDRAVADKLPSVNIRLELAHTEAIMQAVASGLGLGCISRIALRDAVQRGSVVRLKTPFLDLRRAFLIVVHRRKYRSAAAGKFIELCRQQRTAGFSPPKGRG